MKKNEQNEIKNLIKEYIKRLIENSIILKEQNAISTGYISGNMGSNLRLNPKDFDPENPKYKKNKHNKKS